jgi:DHA1 family multidrug resistance protein-like MFS transporter
MAPPKPVTARLAARSHRRRDRRARQPDEGDNLGADTAGSAARGESSEAHPIAWRRNLYAILIAQTLAIVGFSLRVPFLPFYLKDLGVSSVDGQALWSGVINAGGAGVMAITAPIWGIVADRRGRRPMLLRAMFAATCTVGLMGLATQPWHLLALRFVEGALTGTVTASTALVAASTPKPRLGFALGMVQTAVFAGASLGPFFGGVLADRIGYRATFAVAALMLASAGLIVLFVVRERFVPATRRPPVGRRAAWRGAVAFVFGGAMLTMAMTMLVVRFASSAIQPILPLFVEQLAPDTRDPSSLAGLVLGVLGLTSALSAVVLGRLGDRTGHRRILIVCALASGLLYLPMAATQHPWQLIVLLGLFGVAAGGLIPAANALVANVTSPAQRGVVYGTMAAAASLGGFFGPLTGAAVAATLGFRATFVATAFVLLGLAAMVTRRGALVQSEQPTDPRLETGEGS